MLRYTAILLLLFLGTSVFSQNKTFVSGEIKDNETGEPLNYVSIKSWRSKNGTISNYKGRFSISVEKVPDTLILSHVAYETVKIAVNGSMPAQLVKMIRKTSMLPEVPVSSQIAVDLIEKKLFDVVDYEFFGDSILLLAYSWREKKNPWFILMNSSGDTLQKAWVHSEGVFYRDCMDNLFYITERAAWEITLEDSEFILKNPLNAEYFKEHITPCITGIGDKFYVKQYSYNNQVLSYYVVDTIAKDPKEFRIIADEVALRMVSDRNRFYSMGNSEPTEADLRFEQMCFFDPIYAPLMKIKDRVVIFNFVESKFEIYNDKGELQKEGKLTFGKDKNLKEEIYADEISGRVFFKYLKNGVTTLMEYDLEKDKVIGTTELSGYKYIDKIKIHDNRLYFLYRHNEPLELTKLYRLKSL